MGAPARLFPLQLPSFSRRPPAFGTAPEPDLYLYNVVIRLHSLGRIFFALQSTARSSMWGCFGSLCFAYCTGLRRVAAQAAVQPAAQPAVRRTAQPALVSLGCLTHFSSCALASW